MTDPTTVDTTALRAQMADTGDAISWPFDLATVRALCDGYDDAQRLRGVEALLRMDNRNLRDEAQRLREEKRQLTTIVVQQRERFAALVADLRALCDRYENADERYNPPTGQQVAAKVHGVLDRHAPQDGGTT